MEFLEFFLISVSLSSISSSKLGQWPKTSLKLHHLTNLVRVLSLFAVCLTLFIDLGQACILNFFLKKVRCICWDLHGLLRSQTQWRPTCPRLNWFTPNPFLAESGISSSKWSNYRRGFPLMNDEAWVKWVDDREPLFKNKWMSNGIYELIMLSKITVVAKPKLLTTHSPLLKFGHQHF